MLNKPRQLAFHCQCVYIVTFGGQDECYKDDINAGSCKTERQSFMAVILNVSSQEFHAKLGFCSCLSE